MYGHNKWISSNQVDIIKKNQMEISETNKQTKF